MAVRKGLARLIPAISLPIVSYDAYEDGYTIRHNQDLAKLFKPKVALIGMPGAFFPSTQHRLLPEYLKLHQEIKTLGRLQHIYILSINDPYVLQEFAEEIDAEEHFTYIADHAGSISAALGTIQDYEGFGPRSKAFSCIVEDSKVSLLSIEADWRISKLSRCQSLLNRLSPYIPYPGTLYDN
jgi:peroxiredoxin